MGRLESRNCAFYKMQHFFSCLAENRNVYPDITFSVGNISIPAHRVILASVSSYFRVLFQCRTWIDSDNFVIYVDDAICSENILRQLVDFAYTQNIQIRPDNVCDLIIAADYYGFSSVLTDCSNFLIKLLTISSCISIWSFSNDFNLSEVEEAAFDYILRHFVKIYKTVSAFIVLPEPMFNRLIMSEWLNADEREINEATEIWQKHRNIKSVGKSTENVGVLQEPIEETMKKLRLNNEVPTASKMESSRTFNFNLLKERITRRLGCAGDHVTDYQDVQTQRYPRDVLLAIGGWHDSSPSNHVETYDLRTRKWNIVTHHPDFLSEAPRAYHAVIYVDSWLYFIGGYDGVHYYDKVRRYNVESRRWHNCSRMYKKRCYVSAAYLDGSIYACGGLDGHVRLKCAEKYEISQNAWTPIPDMIQSRSDASCTSYNDKIFMCGGFSGQTCLGSVETYTPGDSNWTEIISMISPRSGVVTVVHNGLLWSLGGFNGEDRLRSTEYYDGKLWQKGPNMTRERSNFAGSILNGKIIVCGGYNERGTMKYVESMSFKEDGTCLGWTEEESMNISRSALTSIVLSDLSKDRLIGLLPKRSKKPKQGLETILELDESEFNSHSLTSAV